MPHTPSTSFSHDDLQWFIMTTFDPKETEERLKKENQRRINNNADSLQYFIPYQFLKRRISNEHPNRSTEGRTKSTEEKDNLYNPKDRQSVRANNEARTALKRYIFVRGKESDLVAFLSQDWNNRLYGRLLFYYDKQRHRVTIPQRMMDQFIETCTNYKLRFELRPAIDNISQNEEVILNTTAFRGEKARILQVVHTKIGTTLIVGLDLFAGTMTLRLHDVTERDIIRLHDTNHRIDDTHLIDNVQKQLLAILSRRINRKQTEETAAKDAATLDTLYNYRYHSIANDAARRHLLALMLICAHLRHDTEGQTNLTQQALHELTLINSKPESKAATDIRAYLHAALYIATTLPQYRQEAKTYVQEHNPKSEPLRRLIRLIRKRQTI